MEPVLTVNGASYFEQPPNIVSNFTAFAQAAAVAMIKPGGWPVLVYSHGYSAHRRQNTGKSEELASHGYIVVAVDHDDCIGTVFPDGTFVKGRYLDAPDIEEHQRVTPGRLADLQFVLDRLAEWNREDSMLAGRLDLARIGSIGYSLGGNSAGELARRDARCRSVALLEGYLYGLPALVTNGVPVPVLQMYRGSADGELGFANVGKFYTSSTASAYYCQIKNTEHVSFSDLKNTSTVSSANRQAEQAIRACLVSFFNRHLLGQDDHLLDNPTNAFPALTKFKRK